MNTLWMRKLLVLGAFAVLCFSLCAFGTVEPSSAQAQVAVAQQAEGQETHG